MDISGTFAIKTIILWYALLYLSLPALANAPDVRYNRQGDVFVSETRNTPQEYLRTLAGPNFDMLNKVVWCESGWNPKAKNATSTAGGLFQFLDSTWNAYAPPLWDKFDPYDNIRAGVILYNERGLAPWLSSKKCWKSQGMQ